MPGTGPHAEARSEASRQPPVTSPWSPWTAISLVMVILIIALAAGDFMASMVGPVQPHGAGLPPIGYLIIPQAVAVVLALGVSHYRGPLRETLSLRHPVVPIGAIARAFALLLMFLALLAAALHMLGLDIFRDLRAFVPIVRSDAMWTLLLVAVIGAPLAEELVFRGILFPALAQSRLGVRGAAVVSSAAWTLLHFGYSWLGLAAVFAIGLYFSAMLWRTGSLWATIICHALYNLILLVAIRVIDLPGPA